MSFGMKLFFGMWLVTMVWLVTRIIHRSATLAQWHRASHPQLKHYFSTLLLPLAFWIAPLFFLLPQIPSTEAQLITEQGTVTAYQTNTRSSGRYSPRATYLEGLYLDDSQVCGYLPGRRTDPKEILSWLNPADVTIQYSLDRNGERQIYTLTTGSGAELLSYKQAAVIRWQEYVISMICLSSLLLAGIGWALGLPPRLSVGSSSGGAEDISVVRLKTCLLLLGYLALIFLALWPAAHPKATIHTHLVSTAVDIDRGMQVCMQSYNILR